MALIGDIYSTIEPMICDGVQILYCTVPIMPTYARTLTSYCRGLFNLIYAGHWERRRRLPEPRHGGREIRSIYLLYIQ